MSCEENQNKKGMCVSCGSKEAKYRCPSCSRRTCSLQCVKDHKKAYDCNGVRCKSTYVPKTDYNYNNMINDYRFLEDTERVAYSAGSSCKSKHRNLNRSAVTLLKKARQSGVMLKLMPIGMSKRMSNTSHFHCRDKCIMWRVRWLFPQADTEYINKKVSENRVLVDLLKSYIDPVQSDPVVQQRLKPYLKTAINKVLVFMKVEYQPANNERYYLLDHSKTLKECLSGKTIIEFPTLHVVLPDKADLYQDPLGQGNSKQGKPVEKPDTPLHDIMEYIQTTNNTSTTSRTMEHNITMDEEAVENISEAALKVEEKTDNPNTSTNNTSTTMEQTHNITMDKEVVENISEAPLKIEEKTDNPNTSTNNILNKNHLFVQCP